MEIALKDDRKMISLLNQVPSAFTLSTFKHEASYTSIWNKRNNLKQS